MHLHIYGTYCISGRVLWQEFVAYKCCLGGTACPLLTSQSLAGWHHGFPLVFVLFEVHVTCSGLTPGHPGNPTHDSEK